jgi:hypothetical protein
MSNSGNKNIHVSRLAFFFFFICLGDSQLVSDLAKREGSWGEKKSQEDSKHCFVSII